jgi:hypothetical protein
MSGQAKVTQIGALRDFRGTLILYQEALRDATQMLLVEMRRGVDWVQEDRPRYWPAQVRRLDEALVAAKNALEQCLARKFDDHQPMCYDEKKHVNAVKTRLETAREKVKIARTWRANIEKDRDDFETRITQLSDYAEVELPRAIAALERMIAALDKYASKDPLPERLAGDGSTTSPAAAGEGSNVAN